MELVDAASAVVKADDVGESGDGSSNSEAGNGASDEGSETEAKAAVDEAWLTGAQNKLI